MSDEVLKSSYEWSKIKNVRVLDADGWDRQNFVFSWAELISEAEFDRRLSSSTAYFPRESNV